MLRYCIFYVSRTLTRTCKDAHNNMKKTLYILAGCNGAGKTTASFTMLPQIWTCKEFVNADSIAKGISPYNPQSVAFQAGRMMLERIKLLLSEGGHDIEDKVMIYDQERYNKLQAYVG